MERPAKDVLLDAVASFLLTQARPAIADPALSFRVLIAANLASVIAEEIRTGPRRDAAELARLKELLPGTGDDLDTLNAALAERLKHGAFDAKIAAHVMETLRDKLAVNNPRFDTAMDIEGPRKE